MLNDIPVEQNQPEAIDLLRASRQVYADAKWIRGLQIGLAISAAGGAAALAAVVPETKAWGALYSAVVLLVDLIFLEPAAKRRQELGAKIQELFDTGLYHLPWNRLKVGQVPQPETVIELARRHRHAHPDQRLLENWYPAAAGDVPLGYGRLICQRANMRWDSALRRNYCGIYKTALLAMWVVGGIVALAAKYEVDQVVLAIVLPLLPASVQLVRECRKQEESARDSERTQEYLEDLWARTAQQNPSDAELAYEARQLQDELYDRRRRSPPIPNFLYSSLRERYELQMKEASSSLVAAVQKKLEDSRSLPPRSIQNG